MKKKLALILISLDECFTEKGFSGGGHKVTKHLVLELIESGLFDIDIYCKKSAVKKIEGINSINIFGKKNFNENVKKEIETAHYDYILSSDILLPFANNLIHSNSSKYKTKNGKNKLMQTVLKIYNGGKIKKQKENISKNKAIFTVSESLKNDYTNNFGLDEKKVFTCHPAVENISEFIEPTFNDEFVIGGMVSGGLNKGGYLLLFALKTLPKSLNWKARIICPKMKRAFFFRLLVKIFGLTNKIEILPKQADMNAFYKTIDCYILPSLNEAFGLVVTEAASNFKPSIASSTTGVSELIKDGENGFIFDRTKRPIKNLADKIKEVSDIYFQNRTEYIEISKNAASMAQKLDWKKFVDTIIENMISEE